MTAKVGFESLQDGVSLVTEARNSLSPSQDGASGPLGGEIQIQVQHPRGMGQWQGGLPAKGGLQRCVSGRNPGMHAIQTNRT